jgi:anthranilate 1,2-dioxygenase small subunit
MLPLELERRVRDLQDRYIRVIDDDRLEDWPDLFMADGLYTVTTRENHTRGLPLALMSCKGRGMMLDRVTGLRKINVYEPHRYHHQLSGLQCELLADGAVGCVSGFLVVRTMHTGAISIFATGVYQDVMVEGAGGELRFAERRVITDSRQTDTLLVIPL